VLAVLKQVSAELDAAQRHYLAYKQFGDAGERYAACCYSTVCCMQQAILFTCMAPCALWTAPASTGKAFVNEDQFIPAVSLDNSNLVYLLSGYCQLLGIFPFLMCIRMCTCSILKISPELFFLPADGAPAVTATASDAGAAAADEQDGAAADPASSASATGAPAEDLLVGHR
jgi:hypothetical protein